VKKREIPYDYEMNLKLRVIRAMLGVSDESAQELWRETLLMLDEVENELSDHPRLTGDKNDCEAS